jgi:hypothetical protein
MGWCAHTVRFLSGYASCENSQFPSYEPVGAYAIRPYWLPVVPPMAGTTVMVPFISGPCTRQK